MGKRGAVSWWVGATVVGLVTAGWALPVTPAAAAPLHTWVGPAGGRWSVAANWSPAQVPHEGDDITLPGGSSSIYDLPGVDLGDLVTTGSNPVLLGIEPVGNITVTGNVTAAGPLTLDAVGTGPAMVQIYGTVSAPSLATDGVQVILAGGEGSETLGAASASGVRNDWIGSVNLIHDAQHSPGASLSSGPFGRIDLWGTDQQASSTFVGGSLYLGYYDDAAVTSVLQTGSLQQPVGGHIAVQLGTEEGDQIRSSSVEVRGDLTFGIDGFVPVGTEFTVVDNVGTGPVVGHFVGMAEGAARVSGSQRFRISYVGGTGNDITLTRMPGLTSTWVLDPRVDHGGFMEGPPALSSWGPDRLDAWTVGGDDALWHRWQDGSQSGWERLGGILSTSPTAVSPAPGQVDVFVRGADRALWSRSFRNGAWGAWRSHGGIITAAPAVTSTAPGNLEVVARGNDGALWLRRSVGGVWQPWATLGGYTTHGPAVSDWGSGELQIAIRGGDGALWLRQQTAGVWLPWRLLGGAIQDGPALAAPAPGQLAVYALGGDGKVWHRADEGGGWSTWSSTGIPTSARPAAVGTDEAELQLGVRTASGSLHTHAGHQPQIRGPRDLSSS